jgi:prepilin-type N-terminal cleavage/methylation domain-containing protein
MLKINKKLSKKGFTLIELMVAVAILATVSFGIFLAFSTAFQTFNDAKDRTIATNYAQQILEDYKNTYFEKIEPFSDSVEGTNFFQNVYVQQVDDNVNLKKVIVIISWKGRKNNSKNVNVSTLIYNTQTIAESDSTPIGIIIYANPYNLLPGTDDDAFPSYIFAEIVDEKGNRITDWNENPVEFTIEGVVNLENETQDVSYLGNLSPTSGTLAQGIAETTFYQHTGEEREGFVEIKASLTIDEVEIYDTLTLKVTNDAVSIVLTTNREIISTQAGEETTANLTATIVDAGAQTVVTDREIDINIFSGPGKLDNFIPVSDGVASIDLISETTAGVSTIIATSNLLEPGSIDIEIVDPGVNHISVEADNQTIVQQGSTIITAYLTNYLGEPISGEIIFSSDIGDLVTLSDTTVELTMNYAGTATVTASWTNPDDSTEITDTVEVLCRNHNLYVSVDPTTITEGSSTTISAELTDRDGNHVIGETINFVITEGNGTLSDTGDVTNDVGVASVVLTIYSPGTTNVEASWSYDPTVVIGDVDVICISAPVYVVTLSAENNPISVGGTSIITATVTEGTSAAIGTEVTFLLESTLGDSDAVLTEYSGNTDVDGLASVTLSGLTVGELVTITAAVGTDNDSIIISCEPAPISIVLADPPNIKYGTNVYDQIYFDIIIQGGSINLEKMKISWESSENDNEKLETLYIFDDQVYFSNSGAQNGTTINFNKVTFYSLTNNETYTIKMLFKQEVKDKTWSITFINPLTDEEITPPVNFTIPNP